ncbi:MAG: hypothetical protein JO215_04525 [Ktedonobacteraceae bacterium]|nr:hypothetical protein [Ktedonobacteraceae bacterium]
MIRHVRSAVWIALVIFVMSLGAVGSFNARAAGVTTSITLNGHGSGRTFDGVGGLSGGGGTSRLLIDYPPQQQQEILDYLFKPGYGASLQILKVEIGSDVDSTEGAEASSQRTPTDQNYNRGYEWWLMEQAKARNPHIKLYALEWGAPGWFNGGFWSQDNINYILNWIKHAQSDHGLHIDYIGGWNERGYNITWYENLKQALKSNGFTTQIVGADDSGGREWNVATDMQNNPAFNNAVDIIGGHYPCAYNGRVKSSCLADPTAQSLKKPIWQSEAGSANYNTGAAALAETITHGYIDDRATATINWTLVDSWYNTLPYAGDGLMVANQPWSGNYVLGKSLWVVAQMTQFAQPGWQFLDGASGYLGGNRSNGSYVSLKSPNGKDYSLYLETTAASAAQTLQVKATNGLSTGTIHVWGTNLNASTNSGWFIHQQDITPTGGVFSLTLQPGYVYSVTTTTGQGKGTATSPPATPLSLPFSDNFESYSAGQIPHYFDTVQGAFETAACGGGRSGTCMRQVINIPPIPWMRSGPDPLTVVGDPGWTNYQVSMDARLEQAGYVDLIGGMNKQSNSHVDGYHLRFTNGGSWTLFKESSSGTITTLASGTSSFGLNTWHHLALTVKGRAIQAQLDTNVLATVNDSSYLVGQAAIQVAPWINADFDNFSVTSL